jgi:transcriptional regulator with XRE-family HTH domain
MNYNKTLGDKLRAQRQKLGLSLSDVQLQTGGVFKASALGSYERGDRAMSVHRLSLLCSFYGVHPIAVLPSQP